MGRKTTSPPAMRLLSPASASTLQAGPLRLNALTRPMSPNVGSRSPGPPNAGWDKTPEAIAEVGTTPFTILEMICVGDLCSFFMVAAPLLVVWTLRLHEDLVGQLRFATRDRFHRQFPKP